MPLPSVFRRVTAAAAPAERGGDRCGFGGLCGSRGRSLFLQSVGFTGRSSSKAPLRACVLAWRPVRERFAARVTLERPRPRVDPRMSVQVKVAAVR